MVGLTFVPTDKELEGDNDANQNGWQLISPLKAAVIETEVIHEIFGARTLLFQYRVSFSLIRHFY